MTAETGVAFLRGINVGGRNRLAMADLRQALEAAGFREVRTYIQSGNVLFDLPEGDRDDAVIAQSIRSAISDSVGLTVPVLVRSLDDIDRVARAHPDAERGVPPKWLHVFLLDRAPDLSDPPEPTRFAPDRWVVDGREIYASYPSGPGGSKLTIDVFERSFGVTATARNVTTLAAIVELGRRS